MIITNIKNLITHKTGCNSSSPERVTNISLRIDRGKIVKIFNHYKLNRHPEEKIIDAENKAVIPGLVECHTHTVFAGSRIDDFERRSMGESYLNILKAGGGINHTVRCTREATSDELLDLAIKRIREFIRYGVTTIEIKSGYGLSTEEEIRLLNVIKQLREKSPIDIISTFLGAHTFPPEFKENKEDYVDLIIKEMLPIVHKERLADFCDVFCEIGAFDVKQTERILRAAKRYGLKLKMHADQLNNIGASRLAASLKCTSADHLDRIDDLSIDLLKKSKTTAVLLPYATLFTGHTTFPPARKIIDAGLRVAISTDFNPGSSYTFNLPFCATLGITQMKMSIEEALMAITINAAYAIGREKTKGSIEAGKDADIVILNTADYREFFYYPDPSLIKMVISKGRIIYPPCE